MDLGFDGMRKERRWLRLRRSKSQLEINTLREPGQELNK